MQCYVDYIKSIDSESPDLEVNYEKCFAVERNFQLAIEYAIDIYMRNHHSKRGT